MTAHMKRYVGTRYIKATPMDRQEYCHLRGWAVPVDESPEDEGYLIEYEHGSKGNVPGFEGYISWMVKDAFDGMYVLTK